MLPFQDVAPQESRQRAAEGYAECTVVDANGHAVHCSPEVPLGYRTVIVTTAVYLYPSLYNSREQYGCSNVCASKLQIKHESALKTRTEQAEA